MEKRIELIGKTFLFEQRNKEIRRILYDYDRCIGCGICVYACPVKAIDLQPVHDIALGLEMPYIMIDHTRCVFCGICFSFCPTKAFRFFIDFELKRDETPAYMKGEVEKLEDCVNCAICYRICPSKAIERIVKIRRKDFDFRNDVKGSIEIDVEKCKLCGICVEFCDAFVSFGDEIFEKIFVDESKCDYCKLCEDVCPNDAIKVEGRRIVEGRIEEVAEIVIDGDLCIYCGKCSKFCPYDGIRVRKQISGKVLIYEGLLDTCDFEGCKACINVCPSGALKFEGRSITIDDEICLVCGACENACHKGLIIVKREGIEVGVNESPWTEGWMKAVERIIKREFPLKFEVSEVEEVGERYEFECVEKKVDEGLLEKLDEIERRLKKPSFRKKVERR